MVEGGYVYIAQPPLYKVTVGKEERYLYNDRAMEQMLQERGLEKVMVMSGSRSRSVEGDDLKQLLSQLSKFYGAKRYPAIARLPEPLVMHLVQSKVESTTLSTMEQATALQQSLAAKFPDYQYRLETEEESGKITLFVKEILKTEQGEEIPRTGTLNTDLLDSLEYERLVTLYPDVQDFLPESFEQGLQVTAPKDNLEIKSYDALRQYIEANGKKGLSVQRFKGLGEMMPIQLWDTTMNPATRTLLRVEIEDAAQADRMFDVLMGERVEPRRNFIETNAQYVKNLDI
jgi:DNA gyrase subunit B